MSSHSSRELTSNERQDSGLKSIPALMHLVRSNMGAAVVSMPWAISHAGIVVGPILLLFLIVLSSTTMFSLVECARWYSRKVGVSCLDYGDVTYYSIQLGPIKALQNYARAGRLLVNASITVMQLGICCLYYVIIAQNARQVIIVYWPGIPEDRVLIAILWIPLTLSTLSRDLVGFSWISTIGNVLYVILMLMIFYHIWANIHPIASFPQAKRITEMPAFLSTVAAMVEGISTVLPIENSLKTKEHFTWIFVITFGFLALVAVTTGIAGYLAFGSELCASLTLNFPLHDVYSDAIRIMLVVILMCSYPIQFYVPMDIIWRNIEEKFQPRIRCVEFGVKVAISTLLCICAATLPYPGSIITLAGSLVAAPLQFLYPSLIIISTISQQYHDQVTYNDLSKDEVSRLQYNSGCNFYLNWRRTSSYRLLCIAKNIATAVLGITILIFGFLTSMSDLIRQYRVSSASSKCRGGLNTSTTVNTLDLNRSSLRYTSSSHPTISYFGT